MIHYMDIHATEKDAGHIGKVEKTQGITAKQITRQDVRS